MTTTSRAVCLNRIGMITHIVGFGPSRTYYGATVLEALRAALAAKKATT